jgi:penicillin-binding protein 1A
MRDEDAEREPIIVDDGWPDDAGAPDASAQRPRRRLFWPLRLLLRFWRQLLALLLLLVIAAAIWLSVTAPLSRSLEPISPPSITLAASDGTPIAAKGAIIAAPVELAKLPPHVAGAFMAIEDRRFYDHWGVDPWGIARAAWRNLVAGGVREGGSTITQQLAKVAFLSDERRFGRKAQEMLIAFWLEAWLTKDQILERYLSNVYFGDNVYGLRAAARHYFSRDVERLTVGEAAMLAGLVKAPSRLAPTRNLAGARARARLVLAAMVETGAITEAQARAAQPIRLRPTRERQMPGGTYFADWVLPAARDQAGAVYERQVIRTTLDRRLQRIAERVVRQNAVAGTQMALVAMRPDGQVVAMVGGRSYAESPFNRATQARRQPGSTFKLFVYLAAIRAGMTPDTLVDDSPVTIDGWSPTNNDGRYRGRITLRQAFALSSNVVAARLADRVGRRAVIKAARDLGITSPLGDQPSLALGTSGVTLIELTGAYAAVAGNALPVTPYGLPRTEEGWLSAVWNRPGKLGQRERDMLLDLLAAAVDSGTGRRAALSIDAFGKTGTTQNARDAIFVGFAGDLVVGVWVGRDDNRPIPGISGGGAPARAWADFMASAIDGAALAPQPEEEPENLIDPVDALVDAANMTIDIDLDPVDLGVTIDADGVTVTAGPDGDAAPGPAAESPAESRRPPSVPAPPRGEPRIP